MPYQTIGEDGHYKIMPDEVSSQERDYPMHAFESADRSIDLWTNLRHAMWLVGFCQQRGGWYPFTFDEMKRFYDERSVFFKTAPLLDGLLANSRWLVKGEEQKIYITKAFVRHCFNCTEESREKVENEVPV